MRKNTVRLNNRVQRRNEEEFCFSSYLVECFGTFNIKYTRASEQGTKCRDPVLIKSQQGCVHLFFFPAMWAETDCSWGLSVQPCQPNEWAPGSVKKSIWKYEEDMQYWHVTSTRTLVNESPTYTSAYTCTEPLLNPCRLSNCKPLRTLQKTCWMLSWWEEGLSR